jgi:hypothetical protein
MRTHTPSSRPSRSRVAGSRSLAIVVLAPLVALAAACSDSSLTAPASAPASTLTAAPRIPGLSYSKGSKSTEAQVDTFVYDGKARSQPFGDGHHVQFQANSVCDPATSGYGPSLWDTPCTPAKGPITFVVTSWRDANGRTQLSVSPDVRFVPGTTETLFLNDNPGKAKKAAILWCSSLVNGCVDETLTDPTLDPKVSGGHVQRRIKHFSGYNVVFGLDGSLSGQ